MTLRPEFGNCHAALSDLMLSGAEGIPVPLEAGSAGRAVTVPMIGHGIVIIPMDYAVNAAKNVTFFVQANTNPSDTRNLNVTMAALLKAIDILTQEAQK
jgi:hypothetical protein